MLAKDILRKKEAGVLISSADIALRVALNRMIENKVGSLIVTDANESPIGIITERDILRIVNHKSDWHDCSVGDYMTKELIVGVPEDNIEYIMLLMTINRFRHVPVLENGKITGIISIGDIIKAQLKDFKAENRYLQDYITGKYPA